MPTLLTHPASTFAQRVRIALLELNLDWPQKIVDMEKGEHRKSEFLELNPYHRVPVLEHEGLFISESTAIMEFIADLHPSALLPENPAQRAIVRMHCKLCDLQFSNHVGTIIFPKRFLPESKWRKEEIAAASTSIASHFAILDEQIGDSTWIAGSEFTMADIAYAPFFQFVPMFELTLPANIERWARQLLARPSVLATKVPDALSW